MGGRSGMGEVSSAPNAPAIEERDFSLSSFVPTNILSCSNYVLPTHIEATNIMCRNNYFGPTDMEAAHKFSPINTVVFPRKPFVFSLSYSPHSCLRGGNPFVVSASMFVECIFGVDVC